MQIYYSKIKLLNDSINKKNEIIESQADGIKELESKNVNVQRIADEKNEIIIKQSHSISEYEHKISDLNIIIR